MNIEKVTTSSSIWPRDHHEKRNLNITDQPAFQQERSKATNGYDGETINKESVETIVTKINEFIDPLRTNLKFVFHEQLDTYYVEVINPLTDEVIREIPPKKMLDMCRDGRIYGTFNG